MSFLTGKNVETIYASTAVGIAKASFTTEIGLNDAATMGAQASLPPNFWMPGSTSEGVGIAIKARGILSSTATPTYTFSVRLGPVASITGPIVLGTPALVTVSGASNTPWELEGEVFLVTQTGAATSTVRGTGHLICPGLAAGTPASIYAAVWGGAASPGTVSTLDTTASNFINFNVACSASSASNTITLQSLQVYGLN